MRWPRIRHWLDRRGQSLCGTPGHARNIHEDFYCNRRYAATTSLAAGGLAAQSVDILFQVCLLSSQLRAPVSRGVLVVSLRTLANNAGLGHRLRECTQLVLIVEGRSADEIFGYPDNLKFRSCMTLFMATTTDNDLFKSALLKYFDDKPDQPTLDILAQ